MAPRGTPSIAVEIRWGTSVLHVAHLTPPRSFHLGESGDPPCDCLVPATLLGTRRAPLVIVDQRGSTWLVILPGATGTLEIPGRSGASLQSSIDHGHARPHPEIRGAHQLPFPPGSTAVVEIGGLVCRVENDPEGPAIARGVRPDRDTSIPLAFSLVAHMAFLIASALEIPPLHETPDDVILETQPYILQAHAGTFAGQEEDEHPIEAVNALDGDDRERPYTKCGEENGGSMGEPLAGNGRRRYGVEGPADNADPHLARHAASYSHAWESLIWPFVGPQRGDPKAPTMPWGREDSLGNDAQSARGNMWGDDLGESRGSPGIGTGLDLICETCGAHGRGKRLHLTFTGGATRTESDSAQDRDTGEPVPNPAAIRFN